jgi:hypothetical protein
MQFGMQGKQKCKMGLSFDMVRFTGSSKDSCIDMAIKMEGRHWAFVLLEGTARHRTPLLLEHYEHSFVECYSEPTSCT